MLQPQHSKKSSYLTAWVVKRQDEGLLPPIVIQRQ